MTFKNKMKSIIRRTKWALDMSKKLGLDGDKAWTLATIYEHHIVVCRRFNKQYANEHHCNSYTNTIPFVDEDGIYVMSIATYEP